MSVFSLSTLEGTGEFVSAKMFGTNAVYSELQNGVPIEGFAEAANAFGVTNYRFGGGQADMDPNDWSHEGLVAVEGENWINTVSMPGGAFNADLVAFLDWVAAQEGEPTATLIVPTKYLDVEAYADFADDISTFVTAVMTQYGALIGAIEIGNEHWVMGETAYGIKASIAAEAIGTGLANAGLSDELKPDVLIQMATAGNSGSEFPSVPGVSDFIHRADAANNQIIAQLSDEAKDAIDGVVEHYYFNKRSHEFTDHSNQKGFIDRDYRVWTEAFDKELSLHITEWNVRISADEQLGMASASTLMRQFENMIEMGVDAADIWAMDYHSRTSLTLPSDEGVFLDDAGRVLNSAQGAAFDLMSASLVGKELLEIGFEGLSTALHISAYADDNETVIYVSSRTLEARDITLDLASAFGDFAQIEGAKITMDPTSSDGFQWGQGEDAISIDLNGQDYFYNEHDINVILTDHIFAQASNISFDLDPFEVMQLTLTKTVDEAQSEDRAWLDQAGSFFDFADIEGFVDELLDADSAWENLGVSDRDGDGKAEYLFADEMGEQWTLLEAHDLDAYYSTLENTEPAVIAVQGVVADANVDFV